jgi:hypothetical protein
MGNFVLNIGLPIYAPIQFLITVNLALLLLSQRKVTLAHREFCQLAINLYYSLIIKSSWPLKAKVK